MSNPWRAQLYDGNTDRYEYPSFEVIAGEERDGCSRSLCRDGGDEVEPEESLLSVLSIWVGLTSSAFKEACRP